MMRRTPDCISALWKRTGDAESPFSYDDAVSLRRIAMTLHAWAELECGSDRGAIEREEGTKRPFWVSNYHYGCAGRVRQYVPDRERGALKRLAKIVERYPDFLAYVQSDPRGAPLYIVAKADIPEGGTLDEFYTRGVALYK